MAGTTTTLSGLTEYNHPHAHHGLASAVPLLDAHFQSLQTHRTRKGASKIHTATLWLLLQRSGHTWTRLAHSNGPKADHKITLCEQNRLLAPSFLAIAESLAGNIFSSLFFSKFFLSFKVQCKCHFSMISFLIFQVKSISLL